MSVLQESQRRATFNVDTKPVKKPRLGADLLKLMSSVRLGIVLLILLLTACFIGMLIMQQSVDGFDQYYAELTPAQRTVYGSLGLFDVYHSWYFNALLFVLSGNIVLASIERFPGAWKYFSQPKAEASAAWLKGQANLDSFVMNGTSEDVTQRTVDAMRDAGWKSVKVSEKGPRITIFAQSGVWNRLGAYAVHVGLLTIFVGGFLTAQLGHTGQMPLTPGQTSNQMFEIVANLDKLDQVTKRLPFEVTCTDIQQKLLKKDESLSASNTIDWITRVQIKDETGTHEGVVQMNSPLDYRGYRFFQSSFTPVGRARNITLGLTPSGGGTPTEITIPRDGSAKLDDGTEVRFVEFRGNFSLSKEDPNESTGDYPNPAAILQVTPPNGAPMTAYAFGAQVKDIPIAGKPIAGYTYLLKDFEKVGDQHILSVQRDPGATVVYVGFTLLTVTLIGVFFFSHQRVWVLIEPDETDTFNVLVGGNTNRSQTAFDEKFNRFTSSLRERNKEAQN